MLLALTLDLWTWPLSPGLNSGPPDLAPADEQVTEKHVKIGMLNYMNLEHYWSGSKFKFKWMPNLFPNALGHCYNFQTGIKHIIDGDIDAGNFGFDAAEQESVVGP
ncbi:hypothetical protein BKA82DRAFT_4017139 [Pisolithus tinctorius]|nr:hypothetical protein BKA82DRAFT_4017139 [Pisolithus tinctorius]